MLGSEVDVSEDIELLQSVEEYSYEDDSGSSSSYDAHAPVSPMRAAEALFLEDMPTQTISAAALAQQIHVRHRPLSLAATSVATDDFQSAFDDTHSFLDSPFGKDALTFSRDHSGEEQEFKESMEDTHVDAAEKVYENVKGAWAWGKGIVVFSPFMGMAEGVAGKVVEMAGSNLEEVDGRVT